MAALISVIRNARWIDLSDKHKILREYLENEVKSACIDNNPQNVIMVKGAFGIGKTNTLHYIFHYGWCQLNVPVLYVSLEKLYPEIEKYANSFPSKLIGNKDIGKFLDDKVKSVLQSINEGKPSDDVKLFFFGCDPADLSSFCQEFDPFQLQISENGSFRNVTFDKFSGEIIKKSISGAKRPLLLIDEFETKFSSLKSKIEKSEGGELRELFDAVVEKEVSFHLIIGNGPASGYELKNDRSIKGTDDAESSRLTPKQIPFPLPESTKKFLGTEKKGLLNFAWWASRCRARHFLRLKEAVGSLDSLVNKNSYAEFLSDFTFFSDPIESSNEGSTPITYVRTEYFNSFPEELKDKYLPLLITDIKPQSISFDLLKDSILKSKKYLFCAPSLINVSEKLMVALSTDINDGIIKKKKEEGKFLELDYDYTLRKYFDFFLKSIADENGNIAFGMVDDEKVDSTLCELFIYPLLHLSYDFIMQYEEESLDRNKQASEFILFLLSEVKNKEQQKEIKSLFSKTYSCFKKNDSLDGDGYIQLSLAAIRETFEQPIGEPRLNYKNQDINILMEEIPIKPVFPIIYYQNYKTNVYFIPVLNELLLSQYLQQLTKLLKNDVLPKCHEDGGNATCIIYLEDHRLIEDFKNKILFKADGKSKIGTYELEKFNILKISSFELNFPSHTSDFINSLLRIAIVGYNNGDLNILKSLSKDAKHEFSDVLRNIKEPTWTEKKEAKRTIEHFEKLVFLNEKAEIKSICDQIWNNYDSKLTEIIPQKNDFRRALSKYHISDEIYKNTTFGTFSIKLINLFLFEVKIIPESFLDFLKKADDFNFNCRSTEKDTKFSFYEFKSFIQNNAILLAKHSEEFSLEDSTIVNLSKLCYFLSFDPVPQNLHEYLRYLSYKEHFVISYHKSLGSNVYKSFTETVFNYTYSKHINISLEINNLKSRLTKYKDEINAIRTQINQDNDKLKDLLCLDDLPFGYDTKLGEIIHKIIFPAETLLEAHQVCSMALIIHELLGKFDDLIKSAKLFANQLSNLKINIERKQNEISRMQDKINSYYADSFTCTVLTSVKEITKQNENYYWNRIIINTIKVLPAFESIFKKYDRYMPQEKPYIDKEDMAKFTNQLNEKYAEKLISIKKQVLDIETQLEEVKSINQKETFIKQLLNLSDNGEN